MLSTVQNGLKKGAGMPEERPQRTDCREFYTYAKDMNLALVVGIGKKTTLLNVNDMEEMLRLLAIEWRTIFADMSVGTDLGVRIGDAIYGWNQQWSSGEGNKARPENWKWLGISIRGYGGHRGKHSVSMSFDVTSLAGKGGVGFRFWVQDDEVDSVAKHTCAELKGILDEYWESEGQYYGG
jgi:hypothetical protein